MEWNNQRKEGLGCEINRVPRDKIRVRILGGVQSVSGIY